MLQRGIPAERDPNLAAIVAFHVGSCVSEINETARRIEKRRARADGIVDGADFLVWQRSLGMTNAITSAAAVPEPAPFALATFAFVSAAAHRRRNSQVSRWLRSATRTE